MHLSKTKTILKNIHPIFKILISSFKLSPDHSDKNILIFKDYTIHQDRFKGLRPEPSDFSLLDPNNTSKS